MFSRSTDEAPSPLVGIALACIGYSLFAIQDAVVKWLVADYGVARWRQYAVAMVLMAVAAGCTTLTAYLIGDVINQAYVNRDIGGVVRLSLMVLAIFMLRGIATYGQSVMLSRIGNSIIAENQRRLFNKLLQQNITFFSERHSADLLARFTSGANAARLVLVGHNPGLHELLFWLADPDDESALIAQASDKFPTAAFALLELEIDDWAGLAPGCGKLIRFTRPRDLDPELGPECVR